VRRKPLTYAAGQRGFAQRRAMTVWVGAGLAVLLALAVGDLSTAILSAAPRVLTGIVLTFLLVSGALLAQVRNELEWGVLRIETALTADETLRDRPLSNELESQRNTIDCLWQFALGCLLIAAATYLGAVWCYVL
jgi:hypothetical protein